VADLSFQIFGLGMLAVLVPPALWGWSFLRLRVPPKMGLRLITWVAASLLSCGVLAFVPSPESWPLPTGLGGLLGAGFENLAALATGEEPQPVTGILFAIIIAAPTLALFWVAMGLGKVTMPPMQKGRKAPAGARRTADDDIEPERDSPLAVAIGALVHLGFSARAAFRRARAHLKQRQAEASEWRGGAVEPSLHGRPAAAADDRREPMLAMERRAIGPQPAFDDTELEYPDDPLDAEAMYEAAAPARRPQPSARVAAPAARPTPGSRAAREAQGSLLDDPFGFELPELSLLAEPRHKGPSPEHAPERLEAMARRLEGVLQDFGVKGDIINVRPGPVVTLYELEPAPGIKSSRVISLADDIARSMSAISARVAVVPGRNAIGIELPNELRETVYLREMLASSDFEKMKGKLPICLGKTIGGEPIIADLARMPHLLIAGTTGSGKSVGINTMILSLLYQMTPEKCRLIMVDPKMLELSVYDGIPHLLTPVVTDPSKAVVALKWAVREMEDRYRKMSKIGVRNIDGFNQRVTEARRKGEVITRTVQTGFDKETGEAMFESEQFDLEPLPYIVVIVDEMADLMMVAGKDIEGAIQRLAQMARAAGIHMITATQRPSVDVITGTIKANFPTRISFQVTSKIDSRTILGEQGAEQLLGNGDMLYMAGGGRIRRLHGPFVSDGEVEGVVAHLKSQGAPDYLDSITAEEDEFDPETAAGDDFSGTGDELYDKAVHIVLTDKKASTSYIQRRLAIGYNKAATLIERMEQEGVISQANHAGKREILVGAEQY
jgi:S-DNA-T family DNA segregation ATPase FtsK/SpoIIIE